MWCSLNFKIIRLAHVQFQTETRGPYLLTYLLHVQNIIWKADCHSAYQKISCFL
jgi:hypothetical protein